MLNQIPEFIPVGPAQTITPTGLVDFAVPPGANGILIQVFTANVAFEYGASPNADSLQLLSGLNPIVMRLSSGRTIRFGQVTSGATMKIRYINIGR